MKTTSFPQFNINLGAGNNPNTNDLPVALCTCAEPGYEDVAFMFSCFQPDAEELAIINRTGKIWVGVMTARPVPRPEPEHNGKLMVAGTMPPIVLQAHNPFTETTPPYVPYEADKFLK